MRSVGSLLLTGGSSRRLGTPKAELLIDGERLVDRAARVLQQVTRPAIEVGPGLSGLPAVREEPAGAGPLAALVAGGTDLRRRGAAGPFLVLAVDLPFVEAPLLSWLVDRPGDGAMVPIVDGWPQTLCARYGGDAVDVASRLLATGERSVRALLDVLDVDRLDESAWREVADPRAFLDVDTADDVARAGLEHPG